MAGVTNRGKKLLLAYAVGYTTRPTNFYVALVTSATAPTDDTNVLGDLTEIANGNGYTTGGYQLTPGSTDFDVNTEDDSSNYGNIQIKNVVWTATGNLPASGNPARYAVLIDDNGTVANRQVIAYWDLTANRNVISGQTFTLKDCEIRLTEV